MFDTLKKEDLFAIAQEFGVEVDQSAKRAEIIEALDADGVTWDLYKRSSQSPIETEDVKPRSLPERGGKNAGGQVLMKMVRANPTYQIRGYTFTKKHPFVLVSSDDADYIIDNLDGFRIASPREAEEYYS